ncbi:ELMO/CED-12 family-domain-containing protein [Pelagophyceae sp. CCMP2097]|nr:ELMO/CED-12 family-domain-containing protein [Pelagophyceae sp. CCMP2097]
MWKGIAKRLPTDAELTVLDELSRELREYTDDDEGVLRALWAAALGAGAPAFERTGALWTTVGFQQPDPISDVRGGGVLALRNLGAFLAEQPLYARAVMASRQPDDASDWSPDEPGFYPFAAAGINVTKLLADLCGMGPRPTYRTRLLGCWPLLAASPGAFHECYALAFRTVDRHFDLREASYMDFNSVLKDAAKEFQRALEGAGPPNDPGQSHDGVAKMLNMAPARWGADAPAMSGALDKLPVSGLLSSRKIAKWKCRHFALHGEVCAWFKPSVKHFDDDHRARLGDGDVVWAKAEVHGELTNFVRLTSASSVRLNREDQCSFKVDKCIAGDGSKGKLRLRAATKAGAAKWMAALEKAIHSVRGGGRPSASPSVLLPSADGDDSDDEADDEADVGDDSLLRVGFRDTPDSTEFCRALPPPRSLPKAPTPASPAASAEDQLSARSSSQRLADSAKMLLRASLSQRASSFPASGCRDSPWLSCSDEATARVYFVNRITGATQWELPRGWSSPSSGWAARIDPVSGHTYYFYPATNETTWTLPDR